MAATNISLLSRYNELRNINDISNKMKIYAQKPIRTNVNFITELIVIHFVKNITYTPWLLSA